MRTVVSFPCDIRAVPIEIQQLAEWPHGDNRIEAETPAALSLEASRDGLVERRPRTHRDASTRILHLRERRRGDPFRGLPPVSLGAKTRYSFKVFR